MEEVTPQPNSDKLPSSIRTIGWVTTVFGIAPTISLVVLVVYAIFVGAGSDSPNFAFHPSLLVRILLGISFGNVYGIVSATSVLGGFLLFILDGFGFLPRFMGLALLRRSNIAWSYVLIAHILVFILYLSGLYLGFASKNSIDWLIVLLSPWPLWNLFVIWKLYQHNKLFGV